MIANTLGGLPQHTPREIHVAQFTVANVTLRRIKLIMDFDAKEFGNEMRKMASAELHDDSTHGKLLTEFAKLSEEQIGSVAKSLEKGNHLLSSEPQVDVYRTNGEVRSITFEVGHLDFGDNAHKLKLYNDARGVANEDKTDGLTKSSYVDAQSLKAYYDQFEDKPIKELGGMSPRAFMKFSDEHLVGKIEKH